MSDLPLLSPRPRLPAASARVTGTSGLMTLATGVVVVAALSIARDVMIPITLAILLAFLLTPLMDLLRRLRLGRIPAALLAMLMAMTVILGLGAVIGAQLAALATDFPRYASTIDDKIQSLQGATAGRLSAIVNRVAHQVEHAADAPAAAAPPGASTDVLAPAPDANAPPKPMPVEVHQPTPSPTEVAERILSPILSPLATLGIVVVVAIFILLQRQDLRDRLIRLFGAPDPHRTMMAMDDAAQRLTRYFLTQLALNVAFGCTIGVALFLIGVPSPVLWGIVATLMRFVPYIGSVISAGLPITLAAAVDPGWSMAAWTAALFLITELAMSQIVEPLVYGKSTGLSPVSVVVAAIFWGWLWGPIGLILSMPLTLCLVVLGRHVDSLQFLDVLLGDQPALTPVESFYHRMLAGDLDEVHDYAERALKERSLSSYYDEIAVRGLQLAALDAERGVLTDAQVTRILEGVEELLGELSDHDDVEPVAGAPERAPPAAPVLVKAPRQAAPEVHDAPPPPSVLPQAWRSPSAVLCVAGRSPLDGAVTAMLAQLLAKHGLGARVAPHGVIASRAALATIDTTGVLMVCLCSVSINNTPSHLRYAVRRLHDRLPHADVLVGLWPAEMDGDERLRAAISADDYAGTLREAVAACLARAKAATEEIAPAPAMAG